ncbi:class I SAM-dependent methyltransferase [Rhodothermus marinus]|uniref:Methyltransferase type 11 n=1 Tax=Rhodothermus marinus (strain ATCC 43812 / DSM 4252 / R-10) TaxID=518766 RepID=D0MIG2_RHOM4|nr:methyltransferase domain-containing protein [Rhodothermus marinus]ACY48270.1 Methyltransferase type 11 [Rhodothermus marinus DSM 4252]
MSSFTQNRVSVEPEATAFARRAYDRLAACYDLLELPMEWLAFRRWRRRLWKGVRGPRVLEIGVGTGKNIPYYPPEVTVTAIDLSPRMLERARRRAARFPDRSVELLEMDAQALTFPDDTFDDVAATFVFCSVPDPVRGLREALRVTRPGGRLHLLEHMRLRSERISRWMDRLDPLIYRLTGVHIARRTTENVREAGWVLEQEVDLAPGGLVRHLVARKPTNQQEP